MKRTLIAWCALSVATVAASGQGTFQNLDFEDAQIVFPNFPIPDITAADALRGWTAFVGTNPVLTIQYGLLGAPYPIQLITPETGAPPLSGNVSLLLNRLLSFLGGGSIQQTAQVPEDAQSLRFKIAQTYFSGGQFTASLGGLNLDFISLSSTSNYILYGADVSSFAGQVTTLLFAAGINGGNGSAMLDDIQFSSEPIPEPSAVALILLGGGVLICRRRGRWWT